MPMHVEWQEQRSHRAAWCLIRTCWRETGYQGQGREREIGERGRKGAKEERGGEGGNYKKKLRDRLPRPGEAERGTWRAGGNNKKK